MLGKMVIKSLTNNARISAWTLLTLTTCAALVTLFATTSFEVGKKMSSALRKLGANAVAYPSVSGTADWEKFESVARNHGANAARVQVRVGLIEGKAVAFAAAEAVRLRQMTPYWAVTGKRADT